MNEDTEPLYSGMEPLAGRMLNRDEPTSSARIMVLVASVSYRDMMQGEMLTGFPETNLRKVLEMADIDTSQVYLAAAVCLPPVDDKRIVIEDVERFSPLLRAQLDSLPSIKVILALGNLAVQAVYTLAMGGKFTLNDADRDDIKVKKINGIAKRVMLGTRKLVFIGAYNIIYRTEERYRKSNRRVLRVLAKTLIRIDRKQINAKSKKITMLFGKRACEDEEEPSVHKRQHTLRSDGGGK